MKFRIVFVNRELRFSLGIEEESGRYYLSIPVANRLADYEEYYEIGRDDFERFRNDPASAAGFLARCRAREADELLIVQPGKDRGTAG